MIEYFDRLGWDKIDQLREICGGELGWKRKFPHLPEADKLKFGKIVFGETVKNVQVDAERNVATGYDIPIIFADEVEKGIE